MTNSARARYRWLNSQRNWHVRWGRFYASPILQTPAYQDAERWHRSQALHYQRQIRRLWKLTP